MGLPKRNLITKTTKEIFDKMTQEERLQLEQNFDDKMTLQEHTELIETLKTNPTSVNFDVCGDIGEFLEEVKAGKYDAKQ